MTTCPACSQPVAPDNETCPRCGISLHHETGAGIGRGAGGVWIVAIFAGLAGVMLFVICSGLTGAFWFARTALVAPTGTTSAAGSFTFEDEEAFEPMHEATAVSTEQTDPENSNQ